MRLFTCGYCGQRLYFENVSCTRCNATLGFLPDRLCLVALEPVGDGCWQPYGEKIAYRMCINYECHAVCNWMASITHHANFCVACELNNTIPDLGIGHNLELWGALEIEKRRLVYALLRLGLPVIPRSQDPSALAFDFLADTPSLFSERGKVFTGHNEGLITINIKEADPVERMRVKDRLDEPYRTLLGHFRHESGHYYWDRLIRNSPELGAYRQIFGDETRDYTQALELYYQQGAPANWQEGFISPYATMHPWEDWAETWAHYLHLVDTLETASQFGLITRPKTGDDAQTTVYRDFDPYSEAQMATLIEHWLPLTFAVNSLNRSMGHEHVYPFVLSAAAIEKLDFVHRIIQTNTT